MHTYTFLIVIGWLKLVIETNNAPLIGLDRCNLHDCTNSILDEFEPIQVTKPNAGIEFGSFIVFTYLPIKKTLAHLPTSPNQATYL